MERQGVLPWGEDDAIGCATLNSPMLRLDFILVLNTLSWNLFRLASALTLLIGFTSKWKKQNTVIFKKGWSLYHERRAEPEGRQNWLSLTLHSVKKLDIRADFGYIYILNWHLITPFQKRLNFWVGVNKYAS